MPCVLGLDIGTTSTIGVLIRPPDETLALASRPVALRSDHVGWAEEDPEQWWSNVGEIVRELLRTSGVSAADIAAVGVTGMLPAVVLLDDAGRLLRPSIQQSDARCGAEVEELRAEIDEKAFLAKAGNGINQQLVAAKLRWIERHEPEIFARIATVFGSYDYINWRLTGRARHRAELGARGWLRRPQDGRDRRCAGRAGAYPARRAAAQDRLARNPRRSVGAGRGGKRIKSGNAGHRRRRRPYRLRAWRGRRQRGRRAAQVRRLGRYPDRHRSCAPRSAPVSRLSSEAGSVRPQRMHGDGRLRAQLVRPPVRLRRKTGGG